MAPHIQPAQVLATPLLNSPIESPIQPARKSAPQVSKQVDRLERTNRSHAILDGASDSSWQQMANHVLNLRARASTGAKITTEDMISYSKTTTDNSIQLYLDRAYFTEALLPAISNAQESIHIAMLTFDGGHFGSHVADLLIEKKRQNPDLQIRVLANAEMSNASFDSSAGAQNFRRMRAAGIEVITSSMFDKGLEHRKLIVVDSKVGFFGGSCIGDEYFGNDTYWKAFEEAASREGLKAARKTAFSRRIELSNPTFEISPAMQNPAYKDDGVKVEGSAVHCLEASFLQSWLQAGGELDPKSTDEDIMRDYFPHIRPAGSVAVKINNSVPWGTGEMQQNLLAMAEGAQSTLDVDMAYIHMPAFSDALVKAAERGVKIRIVTNSQDGIDFEPSWYFSRQHYSKMLATGNVEIYELHQYSHRKLIVADQRVVFVSTGNADWHSWERAWDESAIIDSPKLAKQIEETVFDHATKPDQSILVSAESLGEVSWWVSIKSAILVTINNLFVATYRFSFSSHLNNEPRRFRLNLPHPTEN